MRQAGRQAALECLQAGFFATQLPQSSSSADQKKQRGRRQIDRKVRRGRVVREELGQVQIDAAGVKEARAGYRLREAQMPGRKGKHLVGHLPRGLQEFFGNSLTLRFSSSPRNQIRIDHPKGQSVKMPIRSLPIFAYLYIRKK